MSFENLKRSRGANVDQLLAAADKMGGNAQGDKKSYVDDRIWKPTVDKAGNGYAVIRFLPAPNGEDLPWARFWDHAFQGPTGQWYIEKSLTSINQDDPVSQLNSKLWNSGIEDDKATVRKQKRRLNYVSNIMVLSDPGNPENEGKVFLYKFGKKIYDMIMDVMQPQFQDEQPVNPFDFWEGADFKLKIRKVEGYRNYDKSEFAAPSALLGGDDAKLEGVYNSQYALKEFTDPTNYKSYDELKAKLDMVLGGVAAPVSTAESVALDTSEEAPVMHAASAPEAPTFTPSATDTDDEDDTMSYFAKLANNS